MQREPSGSEWQSKSPKGTVLRMVPEEAEHTFHGETLFPGPGDGLIPCFLFRHFQGLRGSSVSYEQEKFSFKCVALCSHLSPKHKALNRPWHGAGLQ